MATERDKEAAFVASKGQMWHELDPSARDAWSRLGWTEAGWSGRYKNQAPPTIHRGWADLSAPQRDAATALGYDEARWNGDDRGAGAGARFTYDDNDGPSPGWNNAIGGAAVLAFIGLFAAAMRDRYSDPEGKNRKPVKEGKRVDWDAWRDLHDKPEPDKPKSDDRPRV